MCLMQILIVLIFLTSSFPKEYYSLPIGPEEHLCHPDMYSALLCPIAENIELMIQPVFLPHWLGLSILSHHIVY